MPSLNEIRKNSRGEKQVWVACINCDKEHWVVMYNKIPRSRLCQVCSGKLQGEQIGEQSGKLNRHWKGGRHTAMSGYIYVYLATDNFYLPMTNKSHYVALHRLIMAEHLGRCLNGWEWVHHKNGIKTDNRIGNLELTTNAQHITDHNRGYQDGFTKGLKDGRLKQIKELEAEIVRLNTVIFKTAVDGGVNMCTHRFVYPEDKPENLNSDGTLTGICKLCGVKDKSYGRKWVIKMEEEFYHEVPYGEVDEKSNLPNN